MKGGEKDMEKTLEMGFTREELEAQGTGLLPDRVEMRRRRRNRRGRRRGGRDVTANSFALAQQAQFLINESDVDFGEGA
jgi:hypothetical protein